MDRENELILQGVQDEFTDLYKVSSTVRWAMFRNDVIT
jgi:hypothetical protein